MWQSVLGGKRLQEAYLHTAAGPRKVRDFYSMTSGGLRRWAEDEPFQFEIAGTQAAFHLSGQAVVDWGDGQIERIQSGARVLASHTYAAEGTYRVCISGAVKSFSFDSCRTLTRVLTPFPESMRGVEAFDFCFYYCERLSELPEGLFQNCPQAASFQSCFELCASLSALPDGLFRGCQAADFSSCFQSCYGLKTLPAGLFGPCAGAETFHACFLYCRALERIPDGLFQTCGKVSDFSWCFWECGALSGCAPPLWQTHPGADGALCFRSCTALDNYDAIPDAWK